MLKQKIFRDKKYGKWIHENLNCCITGEPLPDPHHIKGEGYGTVKAPDYLQMALKHELHVELHQIGWRAFEEKYEVTQRVMVVETLLSAHAKGYFDINQFHLPEWFHELKDYFNDIPKEMTVGYL